MKNWKHWALAAILAIFSIMVGFTACDDAGEEPPQDPPEVAHYDTLHLGAGRWSGADGSGEHWSSGTGIKLSDFTKIKPKQGDVLQFKISGVSNKVLGNFKIELFQMSDNDWSTFSWIGDSSPVVTLQNSFNDYLLNGVNVSNAPDPDSAIYISLLNISWHKNSDGEYFVGNDDSERIPDYFEDGMTMATISNFSISLVVDGDGNDGDGDGDGEENGNSVGFGGPFTIRYRDQFGGNYTDLNEYFIGDTVTILGPDVFSNDVFGYTFSCWNIEGDESGNSYSPGDTFVINNKHKPFINLIAIWLPEDDG
ncbi:MAG: hypothetical protein LBG95_00620 [Treponema sp.]|jgi:hypothetical protein|nr:hypothetical protein [Treponema sp.]